MSALMLQRVSSLCQLHLSDYISRQRLVLKEPLLLLFDPPPWQARSDNCCICTDTLRVATVTDGVQAAAAAGLLATCTSPQRGRQAHY